MNSITGLIQDIENELKKHLADKDYFLEDERDIEKLQYRIKIIAKANRIIDKERKKIKAEIETAKYFKNEEAIIRLEAILKGDIKVHMNEKDEIKIPDDVISELGIKENNIRLLRYSDFRDKNEMNKGLGKDFYFRVVDGFSHWRNKNQYYIKKSELIKKMKKGEDLAMFFLNKMEDNVIKYREKDKAEYEFKNPKKWKRMQEVYFKILKVIAFNKEVSEGKESPNEFKKDSKGKYVKSDSKYPILMSLFQEEIRFWIP